MNNKFNYYSADEDCAAHMPAAPEMTLQMAYREWLEQGDVESYLESLACDGLSWWFDTDIPRLVAHLMPLQGPEFKSVPLSPRLQLLATIAQPVIEVGAVRIHCEALLASGDREAASVAAGAGVAAVWDSGLHFSDYEHWYATIATLLVEGGLSAHAQASLFGFKGLVELTWQGAVKSASESYARQRMLAERAGSNSLLVFSSAATAYCHFYSGRLDAGEIVLADACMLASAGGITHVAYVYLLSCMGLYDVVLGQAQRAQTYLGTLTGQDWYDLLPPSVWVTGLGHLLTALAWRGHSGKLEAVAQRLHQHVIPEHHAFYHCYSHYNLGVVALQLGQAHRALQHAEIACERSLASESPLSAVVPALLRIQALSDLGRDDEALEYLDAWDAAWGESEFTIFAVICALERSSLLLRRSKVEEARASYQRACMLIPPGMSFPQIGRNDAFFRDLQAQLTPGTLMSGADSARDTPLVIKTLGGLRLEVGDKAIHDRKWRGGRSKTLLKALIVHGGQKVPMSQLADLLWPDAEGDQAYRNLKVLVWRLRRLGLENGEEPLPWLQLQHGHLSLVEKYCDVDVFRFQSALRRSLRPGHVDWLGLKAALDLYRGDFLAGDISETWIIQHRERLRRNYLEAALVLAASAPDAGARHDSETYLHRALEIDPLDERIYERLMQIHLQSGYPARALGTYHAAQTALKQGLDIQPGPTLIELARRAAGDA